MIEAQVLDDLVEFARIEIESNDLEPWALILRELRGLLDDEGLFWLVKGYNGFDSLGSAWGFARRWPTPEAWRSATPAERATVIEFDCTQERRGLRGGKVARHWDSYVDHLASLTQRSWVRSGFVGDDPEMDWLRLEPHLRSVWGVGRQTAFEWAEFLAKVLDVPVTAPDARLWESEGPRRSLQRIYGEPNPTAEWLNDRANECRSYLAERGVALAWEDFETVICDFNVMRSGRYYPGRHLAALREEIDDVPEADRGPLLDAWHAVVPEAWASIPPGIDKAMMPVYRDTGRLAPWAR